MRNQSKALRLLREAQGKLKKTAEKNDQEMLYVVVDVVRQVLDLDNDEIFVARGRRDGTVGYATVTNVRSIKELDEFLYVEFKD
jgi:hypothetical protein